jgi:hypothetical protein
MANAKQCDICGKFYAAYKTADNARRKGWTIRDTAAIMIFDPKPDTTDYEELNEPTDTRETCPVCMARIRDFIETLKESAENAI